MPQHVIIKTLNKLEIKGNILNVIKGIYEKLTADIKLNCETLKAFLLRSGIKQGCLLRTLLFNTVQEVLIRAVR
jgi:hypothetical protein